MKKRIFIILLVFVCLSLNAQNQVVRRNGAKKETKTSTTKGQGSSIQKKKSNSSSTKKRTSVSRENITMQSSSPTETLPKAEHQGTSSQASTSPTETPPKAEHQEISYQTFYVNGVSFQMARVVAGSFYMGATSEMQNPWCDQIPEHKVTLTRNYYLGKTEVTQALWKAVMGSNPSSFKGDRKPVENVSWNDCQTFISKLNATTGKRFRLPTEAEWEFAARGGNNSRHYQYSGSNNLYDVAWYTDNSGNTTHDVASKQANELGIYDMSGNVWEWCSDLYGSYSSKHQYDPAGSTGGSLRVSRGGSWRIGARYCRSSDRSGSGPGYGGDSRGLRLVLSE